MKALSIILITVGIMLFLVGCMFKIMHWPDLFKGIYSGPVMTVAGIIILIIHITRSKTE